MPCPDEVARIDLGDDDDSRSAAIAAATRLGADHLVVPPLGGVHLANVLDAVTHGTEGLIMLATAETLRQAVDRMCADLSATRPGLSTQTAREWVGATFDLGLEMTQLRDGRRRAVRLVEFRSSQSGIQMRDVFTFAYHRTAAGGSIEGAFYASGTVPRIVDDLAARGLPVDQSIFRRHPSG
jgi:pilus assembly protein CpaF